eukprot:713961_1
MSHLSIVSRIKRFVGISPDFDYVKFDDIWKGVYGKPLDRKGIQEYMRDVEYGDEHPRLLLAVDRYKHATSDLEKTTLRDEIISNFIKTESEGEINISSSMRDKILKTSENT